MPFGDFAILFGTLAIILDTLQAFKKSSKRVVNCLQISLVNVQAMVLFLECLQATLNSLQAF